MEKDLRPVRTSCGPDGVVPPDMIGASHRPSREVEAWKLTYKEWDGAGRSLSACLFRSKIF